MFNTEININEEWDKWEPVHGLSQKYSLKSIKDRSQFIIELKSTKNDKHNVKIKFNMSIESYLLINDFKISEYFLSLHHRNNIVSLKDWTFFKIKNSYYLKWISMESMSISDDRDLQHFGFLMENSLLHVVALDEPKVTILDYE